MFPDVGQLIYIPFDARDASPLTLATISSAPSAPDFELDDTFSCRPLGDLFSRPTAAATQNLYWIFISESILEISRWLVCPRSIEGLETPRLSKKDCVSAERHTHASSHVPPHPSATPPHFSAQASIHSHDNKT